MKFERTPEYERKLFIEALCDEKDIIKDTTIEIQKDYSKKGKLRAWCPKADSWLQFPNDLRQYDRQRYIADVVEVKETKARKQFFRVVKGSIRNINSEEVIG